MKVAVMTDSNSGIFKRDGEAMGVFVVPMPVVIDDKTWYQVQQQNREEMIYFADETFSLLHSLEFANFVNVLNLLPIHVLHY